MRRYKYPIGLHIIHNGSNAVIGTEGKRYQYNVLNEYLIPRQDIIFENFITNQNVIKNVTRVIIQTIIQKIYRFVCYVLY